MGILVLLRHENGDEWCKPMCGAHAQAIVRHWKRNPRPGVRCTLVRYVPEEGRSILPCVPCGLGLDYGE